MSKTLMGRVRWVFTDEAGRLPQLEMRYRPYMYMQERFMREYYDGKRIEFLNIYLWDKKAYELYPKATPYLSHYYGGHCHYHDYFDLAMFMQIGENEKLPWLWNHINGIMNALSIGTKIDALGKAADHAYKKGLAINMNPDFRLLQKDVEVYGHNLLASVWFVFRGDTKGMIFRLEEDDRILFERNLIEVEWSIPGLDECFKKIEQKNETIIIRGLSSALDILPYKIDITPEMIGI